MFLILTICVAIIAIACLFRMHFGSEKETIEYKRVKTSSVTLTFPDARTEWPPSRRSETTSEQLIPIRKIRQSKPMILLPIYLLKQIVRAVIYVINKGGEIWNKHTFNVCGIIFALTVIILLSILGRAVYCMYTDFALFISSAEFLILLFSGLATGVISVVALVTMVGLICWYLAINGYAGYT